MDIQPINNMEKYTENTVQYAAMQSGPPVKRTTLLSVEPRKMTKKKDKGSNPSLDSYNISHSEENLDPNSLKEKYVPFCLESNEIKPTKVFKRTTQFLTQMQNYQIELLATDNVSTLTGENSALIQKCKRNCEWPLNKSVVVFCIKKIDADIKRDPSIFCTDILSFLHIFHDSEMLKQRMNDISEKLSNSWNEFNSPQDRAQLRSSNEIPILLDKRIIENGKLKNTFVELAMTATTYNYTLTVQNEKCDVKCLPQNVAWKLMYQTENKTPLTGQAVLPKDDWLDIICHPQFRQFYDSIWNKFPLTQDYAEDVEKYFKSKSTISQIVFNNEIAGLIASQPNDTEEQTSSKFVKSM